MASPDTAIVGSGFEISRIIEEHRRQDEKRQVKRAANRKSASTSRARKKAYVDDMTAKNERMKQHALVLSLLPDLVLAVCRTGEMTYVSPACQWLLMHSPEDMTGANIFELVAPECHPLLRKMISDNLSRPFKSTGGAGRSSVCPSKSRFQGSTGGGGDGDGDETDKSEDDEQHCRGKMGNHRERLQQRYRQSKGGECDSGGSGSSSGCSSGGGGGGGGGKTAGGPSTSSSTCLGPKSRMLRIFRGDKTTVWCESRLSVRHDKSGDGKGGPLEIILTLRTVAEGGKTAVAHEFAGGLVSVPDQAAPAASSSSPPPPHAAAAVAEDVNRDADAEDADEGYVEADDDGYQCEVEAEEDSNNSGSGNDSGSRRKESASASSSKRVRSGVEGPAVDNCSTAETAESTVSTADAATTGDPTVGREERSLSRKRQRGSMDNSIEEACSDKSGGDNSSTGGDTGGSTTQESGSCGNEVDSNGEGSNNEGSNKWGDGDGGDGVADGVGGSYRNRGGGGSEDGDGASEGAPADGADFGDDVQTAVQSLMLMGGDFNKTAAP
eukprot:g6537.t1